MSAPTVLEICAGAGGQLLGLEQAGFGHVAAAEIDPDACTTLRANRPGLKVIEGDIRELDGRQFAGIDLLAGGVPCPPFSVGGKQLGEEDERNLFPEALRLIGESRPRAVMLENVPGLAQKQFSSYRWGVVTELTAMGYRYSSWRIIQASDHGVPQLRPRYVLVACRDRYISWPGPQESPPLTVGETLLDLMAAGGWEGAHEWAGVAHGIAPTIVGGSKKHGGPDLGPTRARAAWMKLGVDGRSVADAPPPPGYAGLPRLTVPMVARIQGVPDEWVITGRKTTAYRQVGNMFCPPVARAVGLSIRAALTSGD